MVPPSAKDWTIMTYIAGAENLSDAARDGLLQMKQVGSTKSFNLIAQFDSGSEGPTSRYHLKRVSSDESKRIEHARKVLQDLDTGSIGALKDPIAQLASKNNEALPLNGLKGLQIKIGDKDQPLQVLFDALLLGPAEQQSFVEKLRNSSERKKLARNPFSLIPLLFECLFARDRCGGSRSTSTGDPLVLREFLEWGIESFPSRHRMVVIKGHGDGMSVAWDATPRSRQDDRDLDRLRAVELREAFSIPIRDQLGKFQTFDIVGFNACLMGMIEVYHHLRNYVGLAIASEGPTPLQSWPFVTILRELEQRSMAPNALAQTVLEEYLKEQKQGRFEEKCLKLAEAKKADLGECTIDLSICNLLGVQDIVDHLGNLTELLSKVLRKRHQDPDKARKVVQARDDSQHYSNGDYVDLSDFCEKLCDNFDPKDLDSQGIVEHSKKVIASVRQAILGQGNLERAPNSHGLSIFFPKRSLSSSYSRNLRIKEIRWTDFLGEYVKFKKEGIITEVDGASNEVKVTVEMAADLRRQSLKVIEKTKITLRGTPGVVPRLTQGQRVTVESDGDVALVLNVLKSMALRAERQAQGA